MERITRTSNADFYDNTEQTIIQITEDKLKLQAIKYTKNIKMMPELIGSLGVLVSILLTLCTANFKDFSDIKGNQIQGGFVLLGILIFVYMLYKTVSYLYYRFWRKDMIFDENTFVKSCMLQEDMNMDNVE